MIRAYKKKQKKPLRRPALASHNHHHHQARLPWLFLKQPLYLWHTSWILAVRKRQTQMALRARRLRNSQLSVPVDSSHAASKQERRTHRTEVPRLSWLVRLRWPCRPLLLAKRVILKIHFPFFSSCLNTRCKKRGSWAQGAAVWGGCCWCKVRPLLPLLSYWFS